MSDASVERRFTASAIGVLVARAIALVSVFGLNAILARTLSPADFGQFLLAFSFSSLASLIACVGLNRSIVKRLAEEPELDAQTASSVLRFGLKVAVGGGCFIGVVAGALSLLLEPTPSTSMVVRALLFGFIVLLRTIHLVLAESSRGMHDRVWSNLFGSPAGGPLPHLFFVILLASFPSLRATLFGALVLYLAAYVLTLPVLWLAVFRIAKSLGEKTHGADVTGSQSITIDHGSLLSIGVPLMFTQTCGLAMSQADIWIAGAFVAPAAIALYGAGQRMLALLTIPLQVAGTAIVNYVPGMAKANGKSLQQMVGLAANVGGIPGLGLAIVFLIFAEPILAIVFGDSFSHAAFYLRVLTGGQMVCLLTGPCEIALMMGGHQKTTLKVNVLAAAILFIAGAIATTQFGLRGLAITIACVTASQNLVNWYLARRLLGVWTHVGATGFSSTSPLIPNRETGQAHA